MSRSISTERFKPTYNGSKTLLKYKIDITDIINSWDSYTNSQLLDICLEYKNKPYRPYPNLKFFYYKEINDNEWVTKENRFIYNSSDNSVFITIDPIHSLPIAPIKSTEQVMYHVTSWRGALDITKRGVNLNKSRNCLDFGQQKRFYLTNGTKTAADYAEKKREVFKNEVATLVYTVPRLDSMKSLLEADQEWEQLITYSRRCGGDLDNGIENEALIFGLMCSNPEQVKKDNAKPLFHKDLKYQLAVNKNGLERIKHIGTIFYNKSIPIPKTTHSGGYDNEDYKNYITYDEVNKLFRECGWRTLRKSLYSPHEYDNDWSDNHIYNDIATYLFEKAYKKYKNFDDALRRCGLLVKTYRRLLVMAKLDERYSNHKEHTELFQDLIDKDRRLCASISSLRPISL